MVTYYSVLQSLVGSPRAAQQQRAANRAPKNDANHGYAAWATRKGTYSSPMMEVRNLAGSGDLKDTQSYGTVHYGVPYRKVPNGNLKKKRREKKVKQVESNGSRPSWSSLYYSSVVYTIPYPPLVFLHCCHVRVNTILCISMWWWLPWAWSCHHF